MFSFKKLFGAFYGTRAVLVRGDVSVSKINNDSVLLEFIFYWLQKDKNTSKQTNLQVIGFNIVIMAAENKTNTRLFGRE